MKLKHIKAYGFKSFADKIDIEINERITAIVGPNGSGKSNIVDAIRWVLGEQSVKSLRGSGLMSEVIFKGSKTREAHKRAEVALTFDNSSKFLNTDLNEVEIKRVVYLNGENEYYLNNTKVRLKDILEMFMDSGIGGSAFNIISQGSIEEIVSSKPLERRSIFENAAGVLKYKKRKEESLRKLDRTKDNLDKVSLVLDELETTVLPLKEQSVIAKKYLACKEELEALDIGLIAHDVSLLNEQYVVLQEEIKTLTEQKESSSFSQNKDNGTLEKLQLEVLKLEEQLNENQDKLLSLTSEIAEQMSEKRMSEERRKYESNENVVASSALRLEEQLLEFEKNAEVLKHQKGQIEADFQELRTKLSGLEEQATFMRIKKQNHGNQIQDLMRFVYETKNQIDILEHNIEDDTRVPSSVKNVLSHPRLKGIHTTIGKAIETEETYIKALETALGFNSNFIMVDNEASAKEAIIYLKENKLGRATFLPLNIIEARKINQYDLENIQGLPGFIGVLSDLITYDETYQNIMLNQLGNIVVASDLEAMNLLGKKLHYKYRIVTLDGDILHSGGSLTGGFQKSRGSIMTDKVELDRKKAQLNDAEKKYHILQEEQKRIVEEEEQRDHAIRDLTMEHVKSEEQLGLVVAQLHSLEEQIKVCMSERDGMQEILLGKEEETYLALLNRLKEMEVQKEILIKDISNLKHLRSEKASEIASLEQLNRQMNSELHKIEATLKEKEIQIGKMDIRLDHFLLELSEQYNLTYEKAKMDYNLEIEVEIARLKVTNLKREMNSYGHVNLGAIEEYARLSERYEFLLEQKTDLEKASNDLLTVISEMDMIMESRLKETFKKVNEAFQIIFKELFKGGTGLLKLTDPDDILETGIEIHAEPPGKKLNNISLLSGGEKTLTAIALLFALLEVKPAAFCILDEVEAALDESNVDMFGKYLQAKKENNEFILITHKKRTMEYADTLYGITMQESGVSKIVSVKLERA